MSEHDEQRTFFQILALNERKHPELKWVFAIPNGGDRHPAVAAKLRAEGVKAGIHDVCIPIARGGYHGAFIEFKFGRNKMQPVQQEFATFLIGQNYRTRLSYCCMDAIDFLEDYLGITLTRGVWRAK